MAAKKNQGPFEFALPARRQVVGVHETIGQNLQLGDFDAATFGRGYGEENDFCLRVAAMGWRNVLCDTAYVVHHGGASFGPLDIAPNGDNLARLLARWPDYNEKVARFIMDDPLRPLRERLLARLDAMARGGPQGDLFG